VIGVGDVAPDFDLPATTGQVRLSEEAVRHKATVVAFYALDFTSG
jgi:peroxiredoxin